MKKLRSNKIKPNHHTNEQKNLLLKLKYEDNH